MRLNFPATGRNRDVILDVLRIELDDAHSVIEVASGSGEHAVYFAAALPWLTWQPTDAIPVHVDSIDAWRTEAPNVLPAVLLDVMTDPWPAREGGWDAVFCANMVHIAPWEAAEGLFRGAAAALRPGGRLVTYGPYMVGGAHTAPSNEAFDASLRSRNERWGVRDIDTLAGITPALVLRRTVQMPANNQTLIWERR